MPPKRKYNKSAKTKLLKKYGLSTRTNRRIAEPNAAVLQAAVRRTLFRNAETKNSQSDISDYQQIQHNSFINIFPNNLLNTTPGVNDPTQGNTQNRIGDKITLLKCSIRMMIELNERYSDCTYRFMLVKSARGDTPTINTLFKGLSGNKMLDEINFERYSILYQKWGKIKAPPLSMGRAAAQDATTTEPSTGIYYNTSSADNRMSRATRIIKIDIAGSKFAKGGIIQYEGPANTTSQKFFDYNFLCFAYTNYNTLAPTSLTAGYNVLAINDAFVRLSYKDF